jgi:hypothetical protein
VPLNRAVAKIRGNPQRAKEIRRFGKSETSAVARIRGNLKPLLEPLREYGKLLLGRMQHLRTALFLVYGDQEIFLKFRYTFLCKGTLVCLQCRRSWVWLMT